MKRADTNLLDQVEFLPNFMMKLGCETACMRLSPYHRTAGCLAKPCVREECDQKA